MRRLLVVGLLAVGCSVAPTRQPKSMTELRRQDVVIQRHEYSCGAAALATLLDRFGRPQSEAEVLKAAFGEKLPTELGPDGKPRLRALTLGDLETAARVYGFKVVSVQVPDRNSFVPVMRAIGPGIARMKLYGEYPHFVLLDEEKDGWIRVADPGYGSFWMTADALFDAWDAGDRFFLAISTKPFYAWKVRDDSPAYLKRSEDDVVTPRDDPGPAALYRQTQRRDAVLGSVSR